MQGEIITVGTELLLGDIVDSNTQFLSRELAAQGISVLHQSTVGDNPARLSDLIRQALGRSDLIVLAGGLGPTADDLTKETACEVLGLTPVLHDDSWKRIVEYFENTGREMTGNNQKQAMFPVGCVLFPNDHGTAPGCAIEKDGRRVILLPGPPRELVPMFNDYVAPYLASFSEGGIYSYTVGVFGLPEAVVDERIADLMAGSNPTVAPYAKEGEVLLRVTARAASPEEAQAMCAPILEELRNRLGAYIYGIDVGSLPKVVVQTLKDKGLKIATAESCTAGLLSGQITQVPGASSVFECGVAAYSCDIKHHLLGVPQEMLEEYGAVSPQVAAAMATGVRRVSHATLGVGITGEAGPTPSADQPVGTVYIALADEKRVWTKKITAGEDRDREHIRHLAVMNALDLTRRYLEAMPTVMAGGERINEETPTPAIPAAKPAGEKLSRRRGRAALLGIVAILAAFLCWLVFNLLPTAQTVGVNDLHSSSVNTSLQLDKAPAGAPSGMLPEFYRWYRQNSDVAGHLRIAGTSIDLPVMQRVILDANHEWHTDLEYYRSHDASDLASAWGCLYFGEADGLRSPGTSHPLLVIYGANPPQGGLFSELTSYLDKDFLQAHSLIQMNSLFEKQSWEVFGVMVVDGNPLSEDAFDYDPLQLDEEEKENFIANLRARSLFDTDVEVTAADQLLLLSTDIAELAGFDYAELVVMAKRRPHSVSLNRKPTVTANEQAITPKKWMGGAYQSTTSSTSTTGSTGTGSVTGTGTTTSATEETAPSKVTTNPSATTQRPTSTNQQTTTKKPTSTTKSPTATKPTATQTPPTPIDTTGLVSGKIKEDQFLKLFQIKDSYTGQVVKPTSRDALQMALARLVKYEIGSARYARHSTEAWKAQAVASYTYVLWFVNEKGTPYPFSFPTFNLSDANDRKIFDAVGEVLGVKVLDTSYSSAGRMACMTMYHSSSAGKTASCHNVYWANLPYLQSVSSPYDNDECNGDYNNGKSNWSRTTTLSVSQLKALVQSWAGAGCTVGYDKKSGQPPLYATATDSGSLYVTKTNWYYVKNGKKTYLTGLNMLSIISDLRSHAFKASNYNAEKGTFTVTSYGYGHGVGLSQMGAVGYANEAGWSYQQILKHYYSITSTSKVQLVAPKW